MPCLAEKIHTVNQQSPNNGVKYPLTGIVTINGLTDPPTIFGDLGEFLYQQGLVDQSGKETIDGEVAALLEAMDAQDWVTSVMASISRRIRYFLFCCDPGLHR